jgi:PKD repeat protein
MNADTLALARASSPAMNTSSGRPAGAASATNCATEVPSGSASPVALGPGQGLGLAPDLSARRPPVTIKRTESGDPSSSFRRALFVRRLTDPEALFPFAPYAPGRNRWTGVQTEERVSMGAWKQLVGACAVVGLVALVPSGTAFAQSNQDPTVTATRTPSGNVRVGVPIEFSATGVDADGDTLTYAWDFGDGETSSAQNPSHFYLTAGGQTATVTVSDGKGGTGSATLSVNVQANRNPLIFGGTGAAPAAGFAPLVVQFTGQALDFDGHELTYSWDLDGDGTFETAEQNPSHTYTTAGTHTPVLRAADAFGGVATREVPITVLSETTDPSKDFNVLVFSRTAGFRHSNIDEGITAIKLLGEQHNFGVDAIEEPSLFTDAFLNRYDAVIWLSTTGDVLNDDQQAAFERYIRAGNGYVGIHAAADTEYGWPWYGKLVGAYFRNHPNGTPTATVITEDPTHLSTSHLPARWTRVDEWYNYQGTTDPAVGGGGTDFSARNNPVHVLLKMDESTYAEADGSDDVDDDHPISWCQRYDGGRSWYTGMGHTEASFEESDFLQHVLAGIEIAAGETPDDTCGIVQRTSDVGGSVPATLALTLGSPASFGSFLPGLGRSYEAGTTANVISTAGDARLSVGDPSSIATGRLVNGSFALAQPLEAMASSDAGQGGAFTPLGTDGAPLSLLTYSGPTSNDVASISFRQSIGANEALRTGSYAKTLVFTLSTTTP